MTICDVIRQALEHLTIDSDDPAPSAPDAGAAAAAAPSASATEGEAEGATAAPGAKNAAGGSVRKKLSGRTYNSIKDLLTTKFSGKSSKNKAAANHDNDQVTNRVSQVTKS